MTECEEVAASLIPDEGIANLNSALNYVMRVMGGETFTVQHNVATALWDRLVRERAGLKGNEP